MNIHQVLQEGAATRLGPVEVTKTYEKKAGSKYQFALIKDASGTTALKIWGAAGNTPLQAGQRITLVGEGPRGGVKKSVYQDKESIDANDCRLEIGDQRESVREAATQMASSQAESYSGPDKLPDVMKRCAKATAIYIDELVNEHGFTSEQAIQLAQGAPSWYPLMWFGEKGLH